MLCEIPLQNVPGVTCRRQPGHIGPHEAKTAGGQEVVYWGFQDVGEKIAKLEEELSRQRDVTQHLATQLVRETMKTDDVRKKLADARDRIEQLQQVLRFYADPATYHGVAWAFDSPTGGFDTDFGEVEAELGERSNMPGSMARAILISENPPLDFAPIFIPCEALPSHSDGTPCLLRKDHRGPHRTLHEDNGEFVWSDKPPQPSLEGVIGFKLLNPGSKSERDGFVLLADDQTETVVEVNDSHGIDLNEWVGRKVVVHGSEWRGRFLVSKIGPA